MKTATRYEIQYVSEKNGILIKKPQSNKRLAKILAKGMQATNPTVRLFQYTVTNTGLSEYVDRTEILI